MCVSHVEPLRSRHAEPLQSTYRAPMQSPFSRRRRHAEPLQRRHAEPLQSRHAEPLQVTCAVLAHDAVVGVEAVPVRVMSALPQHRVARICERLEHLQRQTFRMRLHVPRFRGGLVVRAHKRWYHSRLEGNNEEEEVAVSFHSFNFLQIACGSWD